MKRSGITVVEVLILIACLTLFASLISCSLKRRTGSPQRWRSIRQMRRIGKLHRRNNRLDNVHESRQCRGW